MTKPQTWNSWNLAGKTVSIGGRHGVVISSSAAGGPMGASGVIEVCWKVGDALGEEVESFDLTALPASFEVLPER